MRGWLGRIVFRLNLPIIRRILNGTARVRVVVTDEHGENVVLIKNWLSRQRWTLPGGGVQPGESTQEAARRELKEELGLELSFDSLELIDVFDHFEADTRADWQAIIFHCSIPKSAKLRPRRSELLKHAWFPIIELPDDMTEIAAKALSTQNS